VRWQASNSVVMTLPLLLATAMAKLVGDQIEEGCYEVRLMG